MANTGSRSILEQIFNFKQVTMDELVPDMVPATNVQAGLPQHFFECRLKDCSLDLKGLVSTSSTTQWQTFSGATYWMLASYQCTASFLHKEDKLNHGVDCWRCFVVPAGLLLDIGGTVFVSVLQWSNVVLSIQAEHTTANDGKTLWKFTEVCKDTVVVRPIYSFDDIQILPMHWLSLKALSICIGQLPTSWLFELV